MPKLAPPYAPKPALNPAIGSPVIAYVPRPVKAPMPTGPTDIPIDAKNPGAYIPIAIGARVRTIGDFKTLETVFFTLLKALLNDLPKPNSGSPVMGLIGICSIPADCAIRLKS